MKPDQYFTMSHSHSHPHPHFLSRSRRLAQTQAAWAQKCSRKPPCLSRARQCHPVSTSARKRKTRKEVFEHNKRRPVSTNRVEKFLCRERCEGKWGPKLPTGLDLFEGEGPRAPNAPHPTPIMRWACCHFLWRNTGCQRSTQAYLDAQSIIPSKSASLKLQVRKVIQMSITFLTGLRSSSREILNAHKNTFLFLEVVLHPRLAIWKFHRPLYMNTSEWNGLPIGPRMLC